MESVEVIKQSNYSPYENTEDEIFFPLEVKVDPMERLLIADFTESEEFISLEPQYFDDQKNGEGLRVLRYRKDGKVDVYFEPKVNIDLEKFQIGEGIGDFVQTEFLKTKFDYGPKGIDLDVAFTDAQGRLNELQILENRKKGSEISFLAPVGKDIKEPREFFLAYMKEFGFVVKNGTEIRIRIGEDILSPNNFPMSIDREKLYFIRYSTKPFIISFNSYQSKGVRLPAKESGRQEINGAKYFFNASKELVSVSLFYKGEIAKVEFKKGIPPLKNFRENEKIKFDWSVDICDEEVSSGVLFLNKLSEKLEIEFEVKSGWKPKRLPFKLNLITYAVRFFRSWPSAYRWKGELDLEDLKLTGSWRNR